MHYFESHMNCIIVCKQMDKAETEKKDDKPLFSKSSLRPTSVMPQVKPDPQKRLSPVPTATPTTASGRQHNRPGRVVKQ